MGLQQRRGLVEGRLVVVVAVDGVDELDVRVVGRRAPPPSSSIQAFWFVALAVADRIAISPSSPICSAIRSTWTLAMPSALAWLTNRSRQSGSVSESKVTTLVPAVAGLVERVADRLRVVGRDHQRVDALLGRGVDVLHLRVRAWPPAGRPPRTCRRTPRPPSCRPRRWCRSRGCRGSWAGTSRGSRRRRTPLAAAARRRRRRRRRGSSRR